MADQNNVYSKAKEHGSKNNEQFFDYNLGFVIGQVHRKLRKQWHLMLEPLNLSPPQSAVLSLIAKNNDISQREAARKLEIDVMAVRRVLQDLEKIGLVRVNQNQIDPRKFSYSLTESGTLMAIEINKLSIQHKKQLESILGPYALRKMFDCLSKILD